MARKAKEEAIIKAKKAAEASRKAAEASAKNAATVANASGKLVDDISQGKDVGDSLVDAGKTVGKSSKEWAE